MRGGWDQLGFQRMLLVVLMLQLRSDVCLSLNSEGLALLEFRSKVNVDPHGTFKNWNPEDNDPCNWSGVRCIDGKVETLSLKELSLGGILAPELGKLSYLRSLILYKNNFSGVIPKEIGGLTMLELLDLRGNNLSGTVPAEIGEMLSLRHLLLCDEKFQSSAPLIEKLNSLSELKCDQNLSFNMDADIGCINRKVGHCIMQSGSQQLKKAKSLLIPIKGEMLHFLDRLSLLKFRRDSFSHEHREKQGVNIASFSIPLVENAQHTVGSARRKLLQETRNLPAAPVSGSAPQAAVTVPSIGSGSFPAVPNSKSGTGQKQSDIDLPPKGLIPAVNMPNINPESHSMDNGSKSSGGLEKALWIVIPSALVLTAIVASTLACRHKGAATIGPWKTGLSGQLQKAFVAGVPKLERTELEAACEDFSNIISSYPECTVFKGTLSSGVEISVVSTVLSAKDWSKRSETHFRRKIDTLSRINHKNYINLLGYCEENEPFMRMMVFEYASNGTLSEHLHAKEFEHLDWSVRMRIIMGVAYCAQYMHHELNPPIAISVLQSSAIFLTDDHAAKIVDASIWKEIAARRNRSTDEDMDFSDSPYVDLASNVYDFGLLMLEIISGKPAYNENDGSVLNWAHEYLNDKRNIRNLVDPALKSFKNNELEVVTEVIQECIHGDPKDRPTMKEIAAKLREELVISPEAATPRLSPLWWAELEILSVEAS